MNLQKLKQIYQKFYKESVQWNKDNIGLPIGIGIIAAFLFFFLAWFGAQSVDGATPNRLIFSFIVAIFSAIASAVATFAIILWNRSKIERKTEGEMVKDAIAEAVTRLEAEDPYYSLKRLQTAMPWPFIDIFTKIMKDSVLVGGGIIVNAAPKVYLQHIVNFLNITQRSFQATLRGGEFTPLYTIDWFDKDDEKIQEERRKPILYPMKREEKIGYLDIVNEKKGILAERILIFDKDNENEFKAFLNPEFRKIYFTHNNNVHCYLISPKDLIELLKNDKELSEIQVGFIYEDFAIFDDRVVLKHNSKTSLIVSIERQISYYKAVFSLLKDRPAFFLKINETHIGNKTWKEFAEDLDWFNQCHSVKSSK